MGVFDGECGVVFDALGLVVYCDFDALGVVVGFNCDSCSAGFEVDNGGDLDAWGAEVA